MKFFRLRLGNIVIVILASAVLCYGQHGRGGGATGPSSSIGHTGNSGNTSDHSSKAGSTQSQKPTLQDQLDDHSKLTAKLTDLLKGMTPPGTTPQQACQGFKNLGQCVAAIHVAHNLGITSFSDLAGKLTGPNRESLGKAIHDLRPDVNAGTEKKKAEKQAKNDINGSAS